MLWIISEICYYLGLLLAALVLPTVCFCLWTMSLVGKADPNYAYLLLAWLAAVATFVVGVMLKNHIYAMRDNDEP